jgi:uncharacterized protein YecE (DUF72 family)
MSTCDALEVPIEGKHPPTIKTLNRWRVESPQGFAFVLHVDPTVAGGLLAQSESGKTALTEEILAGWKLTLDRAGALAAKALLLRTPAGFMPGERQRALIQAVSELDRGRKLALIWEAEGLWDVEHTRTFAEALGLVYAFDPFLADREELPMTSGTACFVLTERASMRRKFDQFDMERLVDWASAYERVFVLLRGRFKWEHARELRHVLQELGER